VSSKNIDNKPVKEKQDVPSMRLITEGMGIDLTFPMEQMSTPLPIVFSPFDRTDDIALLQGGVQATAVENGLALNWIAPFGYWTEETRIPSEQQLGRRIEREAFAYAYHVYNFVLNEVLKIEHRIAGVDGTKQLHIQLDELSGFMDRLNLLLQEKYARLFRLREESGYFRWIGSGSKINNVIKYPSTIMEIPAVIEGRKSLYLRAHTTPLVPGSNTPLIPIDSNIQPVITCGLLHGFENRDSYHERTAIRAALLHYVFKGDFETNKLVSAASRAGIFPRLGSRVAQGISDMGKGMYMWQRLLALGIASEYFKRNYIPSPIMNTGEVRFTFSGSGFTKVLEEIISTYVSSGMLGTGPAIQNKSGGLFFMPASNELETVHKFAFCRMPEKEIANTIIGITDLKTKQYINWHSDEVRVSRDGMLNVTEMQQKEYGIRPVTISQFIL